MLTDPNLLRIQRLYNAHEREINFMLDLCKGRQDLLELIYFRCKLRYYSMLLPTTPIEVFFLQLWKPQRVRHKETGQLGHINDAYKYVEDNTRYYYGVQWDSGKDCKYKLTFWQPRHKFDII